MAHEEKNKTQEDEIDVNLKRVYQEVVEEEIPDRFRDLLNQLRTQDDTGKADNA